MSDFLSMDQVFINKLTGIVQANLSDEHFSVSKLAKEVGMSYSTIHRKLKSIKNQDVSEFISEIRLQHAMELLVQNAGTVSEIAFTTGFNSPTYFTKCFHDYYGFPPGDVKKRNLTQASPEKRNDSGSPAQQSGPELLEEKPVWRLGAKYWIVFITAAVVLGFFLQFLFLTVPKTKEYNRSIVVLPFKNKSEHPGNQYLADGIMEDILNNLYSISKFRVVSRTTSEYFRESTATIADIAKKVNARYVLESSLRQFDGKTRITAQLIDAKTDQHLWAENFDMDLKDIITIQGIIAKQVALRLKVVITDTEIKKLDKVGTKNTEAYDHYLRGRFFMNNTNTPQRSDISKEGLNASIGEFEKAIAIDSSFAEAYSGLANAWLNLAGWGWVNQKEGFQKARELSIKALEINNGLSQAHAARGSVCVWFDRNFEEGRREFLLSLRSDIPYPPVYQSYAQLLMITGPIEEARIFIDRALELEPYYWVLHNLNAWIFYFEGKYSRAIGACQTARQLKPDYIFTDWLLFLNYAKSGEGDRAVAGLQKIIRSVPAAESYAAEIRNVYNESGIPGLFEWLIDINMNRPLPMAGMSGHPFFIAWWNAILGNREQSLFWLERNMESRSRLYEYFNLIATNPDFDILRKEPRFLVIIEKIGLKPYHTRKAR